MNLINITYMSEILSGMNEIRKKGVQCYEEVSQVGKKLSDFSGMESIRRELERISENMMEDHQTLLRLEQCGEDVCKTYTGYEQRISDHVEETKAIDPTEYLLGRLEIPEFIFTLLG